LPYAKGRVLRLFANRVLRQGYLDIGESNMRLEKMHIVELHVCTHGKMTVLLESNSGEWDGQGMWFTYERREMHTKLW
jgi:hypothetical protein